MLCFYNAKWFEIESLAVDITFMNILKCFVGLAGHVSNTEKNSESFCSTMFSVAISGLQSLYSTPGRSMVINVSPDLFHVKCANASAFLLNSSSAQQITPSLLMNFWNSLYILLM